jgi:hypothetical protein
MLKGGCFAFAWVANKWDCALVCPGKEVQYCSLNFAVLLSNLGCLMNKVITGLVILLVVVVAVLRAGGGLTGAIGLGYLRASGLPIRLRRFLFGERSGAHLPPGSDDI